MPRDYGTFRLSLLRICGGGRIAGEARAAAEEGAGEKAACDWLSFWHQIEWRKPEEGMSKSQVRSLLRKPDRVKAGFACGTWYYSYKELAIVLYIIYWILFKDLGPYEPYC